MSERERLSGNRRKQQADWVVNASAALSVVAWVIAFLVFLVLDIAAPERNNFFSDWLGEGHVRTEWDTTMLPFGLIFLVFSFLCSVAAFIFNMMRMRRKTDKYRKSVIFMGFVTLAGIVAYIIRFGVYIF